MWLWIQTPPTPTSFCMRIQNLSDWKIHVRNCLRNQRDLTPGLVCWVVRPSPRGDITGRWRWETGLTGQSGCVGRTWWRKDLTPWLPRMGSGLWSCMETGTGLSPPCGPLSHWRDPPAELGSSWTVSQETSASTTWLMDPISILSLMPLSQAPSGPSSACGPVVKSPWPSAQSLMGLRESQ